MAHAESVATIRAMSSERSLREKEKEMKFFKRVGTLFVAVSAVSVILSAPAKAEEPVAASAVSSVIKNVGEPKCVDGQEVQGMALVLTLKDASG